MHTVYGLEHVTPLPDGCVLTVGNFDGVHRAHQHLLARARALASDTLPLVVLTFDPHPLAVVAPHRAPPKLTPLPERLRWLERSGVDVTVVARSEPTFLHLPAERFVEDVLVARFHPRYVIEGPTFGFGRDRRGDNALLARLGPHFGFQAHVVEPLTLSVGGKEELISSSLVRDALRVGNLDRANQALGRRYALLGRVVHGDARGRRLGFPTANLDCEDQLIPADGVYAGQTEVAGRAYAAAINIGSALTFGCEARRVEAHLLDFDGDLYDTAMRLELAFRIREPRTFPSAETLREQVARDVLQVRRASLSASDDKTS